MTDERKYLVLQMVALAISEIVNRRDTGLSDLSEDHTSVSGLVQSYGEAYGVSAVEADEVLRTPLVSLFRLEPEGES